MVQPDSAGTFWKVVRLRSSRRRRQGRLEQAPQAQEPKHRVASTYGARTEVPKALSTEGVGYEKGVSISLGNQGGLGSVKELPQWQNKTRNAAIAEGPREVLVSRNSATTKHPIWVPGLLCGIIGVILRLAVLIQYRSVADTHTHAHTQRETDRDTITAYTALSIASRGKNRQIARPTKYNYQATSVGW